MKNYTKLDNPEILSLLFHPRKEFVPNESDTTVNVSLSCNDDTAIGCRFHIFSKEAPTILYFHGNGETAVDYDEVAKFYLGKELNLFVATYRGYGWSEGTPTATDMIQDSTTIFQELKIYLEKNKFTGPIIVMGRSLGSVSAIQICSQYKDDIKGMVLESAFADTLPLLETLGVNLQSCSLAEEDGFENKKAIEAITLPTLILHGSNDTLIPMSQAEKLQIFCGARAKKFFLIPGADHNTTISAGGDSYFTSIKDFIDVITGVEVWKKRKKYRDKKK